MYKCTGANLKREKPRLQYMKKQKRAVVTCLLRFQANRFHIFPAAQKEAVILEDTGSARAWVARSARHPVATALLRPGISRNRGPGAWSPADRRWTAGASRNPTTPTQR